MGGNEVGDEVEAETPPDGPKDVASNLLHAPHHADAVVHLWQVLEQENRQEDRRDLLDLLFSQQLRHHQPKNNLHSHEQCRHEHRRVRD